jgi:hypothetical protein
VPVGALLALSAFELHSHGAKECIESINTIRPGTPVELSLSEPVWLSVEAIPEYVYRVDVSGPDRSSIELWSTYYDSGVCTHSGAQIDSVELEQQTASLVWTSDWDEAVKVIPSGDGGEQDFVVSVDVLAIPPHYEEHVLVVPAVAHAAGANGTFFRSDLKILNLFTIPVDADLTLLTDAGEPKRMVSVRIEPNQVLALDDVVLSQFGLDNASGALEISCYRPLLATSRTYTTTTDGGTYGQRIPAERWLASAGQNVIAGDSRTLLYLAKSDDFRSNLGLVEVLGLEAGIELEMFDETGSLIASGSVSLPPFSYRQLNDVFEYLDAPAREHAGATVTVSGHARIFTYGSVVDNRSSDPTYVRPSKAMWRHVIPAAACADGGFGTRWRTDLRVMPRDEQATAVKVEFYPSDGSAMKRETFDLNTAGVLAIEDVVGRLGGSGTGALVLTAVGFSGTPQILATSRTYNLAADGTYGQLIPTNEGAVNEGVILGVERSERFRTNIGMFNWDDEPLEVLVRLVSGTGTLLGSDTWHLEPNQHVQLNDIFAVLNVPWQSNCRVDLLVDHSWRSVWGYGSVVDNQTGDPVYIPAMKLYETYLSAATIELSNRSNAFLLDELDEAVGVDQLPAGVLTATVGGSGDLGRPELPIQVLCMYKSPAGELRSAAVPIGGSISEIGGGERFWCVIPDWISNRDNSGEVTVTISGGAEPVVLTLDARDSSILLDQQLESVVSVQPATETYQVVTNGDLGRPELSPQVVVMHRDAENGRLRVRTPVDGELIDRIETDFQLLVVVMDWINRDDNTGTTSLVPACTTRTSACGEIVSGSITVTDCNASPLGVGFQGEQVTFSATAGQVVSVTSMWESFSGSLFLVDPSGTVIAQGVYNSTDNQVKIREVTLAETGTYAIWVTGSYGFDPCSGTGCPYTIEISCQG